jgi:hypothetical protein
LININILHKIQNIIKGGINVIDKMDKSIGIVIHELFENKQKIATASEIARHLTMEIYKMELANDAAKSDSKAIQKLTEINDPKNRPIIHKYYKDGRDNIDMNPFGDKPGERFPNYISYERANRYLNGKTTVPLWLLTVICHYLGVSFDEFMSKVIEREKIVWKPNIDANAEDINYFASNEVKSNPEYITIPAIEIESLKVHLGMESATVDVKGIDNETLKEIDKHFAKFADYKEGIKQVKEALDLISFDIRQVLEINFTKSVGMAGFSNGNILENNSELSEWLFKRAIAVKYSKK